MVHYGHSCLVPIQECEGITMLYVFVTIDLTVSHFIEILKANFEKNSKIALVTTIQFASSLKVKSYLILVSVLNKIR